jgi:hypothetical protein
VITARLSVYILWPPKPSVTGMLTFCRPSDDREDCQAERTIPGLTQQKIPHSSRFCGGRVESNCRCWIGVFGMPLGLWSGLPDSGDEREQWSGLGLAPSHDSAGFPCRQGFVMTGTMRRQNLIATF